jgi:hypothetical protein
MASVARSTRATAYRRNNPVRLAMPAFVSGTQRREKAK